MQYKPKLLQLHLPVSTRLRYLAVVVIAAHLTVKKLMIVVTGNRVTRKLLKGQDTTMKQNKVGSPYGREPPLVCHLKSIRRKAWN